MTSLATVLTALAICWCLCSIVCSNEYDDNIDNFYHRDGVEDCSLWVPEKDTLQMPIPFTTNGKYFSIIYADKKGHLKVKYRHSFKLSCATAKFALNELRNTSEVLVNCAGKDSLRYGMKTYRYADFKCDAMPKSVLRVTNDTCQSPNNYIVATVGFQMKYKFLNLFKVCFDKSSKNSLYAWYDSRSPYYNNHQIMSKRPAFSNTRELYGKTDVNKKYTLNEQKKTVAKILRSNELADKYIKNDNKHFLSRGHYVAKVDFFFAYEQSATFYYANVAPQWQIFNGNIWAHLEESTRRKMDGSNSKNLIVTGTYGSCSLPDIDGVEQPLFLDLPNSIPVPLFYWKLYYDLHLKNGTVYIGLNNPYKEIDDSVYICPNVCPEDFDNDTNEGLIYCCTKESFEEAYGSLDPIVFQQI